MTPAKKLPIIADSMLLSETDQPLGYNKQANAFSSRNGMEAPLRFLACGEFSLQSRSSTRVRGLDRIMIMRGQL